MPRVLFIDQTSQLGGAELCLRDLVLGRHGAGDRVALFEEGRLAELLRAEGIDVVVAPMAAAVADVRRESGLRTQLAAIHGTQQQVRRMRELASGMSAIYVNTAKALVVASLAFRHRATPMIYHLHDIVTSSHFSRANRWVLVQLANCYAARVIANSQATADAFIEAGGKRRLVTVIPNGFDPEPFDRAIENSRESSVGSWPSKRNAAAPGLSSNRLEARDGDASNSQPKARRPEPIANSRRPIVAVFGRLAPWKGQDVAIRAVAQLANVELWIVGEALFGEDDYAEELRKLVRELDLEDRVKFLGFRDDVLELMQQADVIAHTSVAPEPFGRVVVEGMLSARPVVASRGGGAMEIIEDGNTGLLATMGDADDLARCIGRLLDDPGFAEQLATQAARTARDRYAIDRVVAQTNAVIEQVATCHAL